MIQEQVTPEEWRALCAAPWAVGWYMATATGGKVQEVRELLTLRTTLHQALERDCDAAPLNNSKKNLSTATIECCARTRASAAASIPMPIAATSGRRPALRFAGGRPR